MTLSQTLSGGRKGTEKPSGAANSEMGEGGGGRRVQKGQQGAGQATGARASALSRVGYQELYRQTGACSSQAPQQWGDLSGLRKQMAFPESGSREMERTQIC